MDELEIIIRAMDYTISVNALLKDLRDWVFQIFS